MDLLLSANRKTLSNFIHYHCIIHQEALCGKVLNTKETMDIAMQIVFSIHARSLHRRLFRAHLEAEAEAEHTAPYS